MTSTEEPGGPPTAGDALMPNDVPAWGSDFLAGCGEMGRRVRLHGWAGMPLGPPEAWPQALQTAVAMVLASGFPACIVWGSDLVTIPNDAFQPILGGRRDVLGHSFREVWGEAWERIGPMAERALGGEGVFVEDLPLTLHRNGYPERAYFTLCCSPLRHGGEVAGFMHTVIETTGKVVTERRQAFLLRLEERLRGLADPRAMTHAASEALGLHVGAARAGYGEIDAAGDTVSVERDWTDGGVPSLAGEARLLDAFGSAVIDVLRAGRTLVVEDCLTDPRTAGEAHAATWASIGTRSLVVVPLLKEGRLSAVLYVHEPAPRRWTAAEVSLAEDTAHRTWSAFERARAEAALAEREERLRLIVENARDYAIFTTDAEGRIDTWLAGAASVFGWSAEEAVGMPVAMTYTPEDRAGGQPGRELAAAARDGAAPNVRWHLRRDGSRVFIEGRAYALRRPDGIVRGFLKIGQDVTARRAAEDRQAFLAREVNHRAKNALTVVQAALRLTPRNSAAAYARAVEGRVIALARAQSLLTEERWTGAGLLALLEGELAPFLARQRVELEGPPVRLPASMAQPLAICVHELATNAVKYGALSVPEGRVSVSWRLEGDAPGVLVLHWAEAGGPPVAGPPPRRGFGARVLEGTIRRQLAGTVALRWAVGGLAVDIALPLGPLPGVGEAVPEGAEGEAMTAADPPGDSLAVAERHVAEAERRVARQQAVVALMEERGDGRPLEQARAILATLQRTARLARQHLRIEQRRRGLDG